MKKPKLVRLRLPPIPPGGLINSIVGGSPEDQMKLDRWKDKHNAKVMKEQAAWDAWLHDNPEPTTKD
jgi:hypothetical protein